MGIARQLIVTLALAVLLPFVAPTVHAQTLLDEVFSEFERQAIERYLARTAAEREYDNEYGNGNGNEDDNDDGGKDKKAKKDKKNKKAKSDKGNNQAPPGLAKRKTLPPGLAKREALPPGLAKREFPSELLEQLPEPAPGTERVFVDGNAVLIEIATRRVLDVIEGILVAQ